MWRVCVYMCICMSMSMYVSVSMAMYMSLSMYTHTHTYKCECVCVFGTVPVYDCVHVDVNVYVKSMCTGIYVCLHVYLCIFAHVNVYVYGYVFVQDHENVSCHQHPSSPSSCKFDFYNGCEDFAIDKLPAARALRCTPSLAKPSHRPRATSRPKNHGITFVFAMGLWLMAERNMRVWFKLGLPAPLVPPSTVVATVWRS